VLSLFLKSVNHFQFGADLIFCKCFGALRLPIKICLFFKSLNSFVMYLLSEEQVWDVIDGVADAEVLAVHEGLMVADAGYRDYFVGISQFHAHLKGMPLESPSMRFEESVLEKLDLGASVEKSFDFTPYYFIVSLIAFAVLGFLLAPDKLNIKVPYIKDALAQGSGVLDLFKGLLGSSVVFYSALVLNLGIFLVVLDRKVLKPYFVNYEV
jgi:hypothetical protein